MNESANGRLKLYTAQTKTVMDCIMETGVSRVKNAYIEKKYGESAWIFREAYTFFSAHMEKTVPRPAGAESPVWLHFDPIWVYQDADMPLIELMIEPERLLIFEREKWQKVLNLSLIGETEKEEADFREELQAMGLNSSFQAFSTPFYPQIKARIKKSWERLFTLSTDRPDALQAAVWELRREDIVQA
ncbi:MAG: DUF3841 domain-containing protein [Eubacteriales bacterium]|nr:DUF3841 domain-containing protein [Eubacteriales bacterium]